MNSNLEQALRFTWKDYVWMCTYGVVLLAIGMCKLFWRAMWHRGLRDALRFTGR